MIILISLTRVNNGGRTVSKEDFHRVMRLWFTPGRSPAFELDLKFSHLGGLDSHYKL